MNVRCAWFLKHLNDNELVDIGWCPCEALIISLRQLCSKNISGWGLSCLVSLMYNAVRGVNTVESDHPLQKPIQKFKILRGDIHGFWMGHKVVRGMAPVSLGKNMLAWRHWRDLYGNDNVGGGYHWHRRGVLLEECRQVVDIDMEDTEQTFRVAAGSARNHGHRTSDNVDTAAGHPPPRAEGSVHFEQCVFQAYLGGIAYFPPPGVGRIPTATLFYPEYVSKIPDEYAPQNIMRQLAIQLHLSNNWHRHNQTGFRLPLTPPPTPPASS